MYLTQKDSSPPKRKYLKCLFGTSLYILSIPLLLFLLIFVLVPIIYRYSPNLQRSIVLPTWSIYQKNYSDVESFNIKGVKNFYLNTNDADNVTIGVWEILPLDMLSRHKRTDDSIFQTALKNCRYNILLYLHGNGSDRTFSIPLYKILKRFFHVFAVDYRGYGDSTRAEMTETGIVNDMIAIFKWLNENSDSRIFIWGHSLGTGVATHLVSELKKENLRPAGLILESPFTSVGDVVAVNPIVKIFSWLPWSDSMFLDPLVEYDINFNSKEYIKNVDCPIMILHAKDDTVIPYEHASQLNETAVTQRNTTAQGNVTYHLFEAVGYDHMDLYQAPELANYIWEFINECYNFEEQMKNLNSTFTSYNCKMISAQ